MVGDTGGKDKDLAHGGEGSGEDTEFTGFHLSMDFVRSAQDIRISADNFEVPIISMVLSIQGL